MLQLTQNFYLFCFEFLLLSLCSHQAAGEDSSTCIDYFGCKIRSSFLHSIKSISCGWAKTNYSSNYPFPSLSSLMLSGTYRLQRISLPFTLIFSHITLFPQWLGSHPREDDSPDALLSRHLFLSFSFPLPPQFYSQWWYSSHASRFLASEFCFTIGDVIFHPRCCLWTRRTTPYHLSPTLLLSPSISRFTARIGT